MVRWRADPRVAAVAAELAPYAWRDLTGRMLARRVVGAADRYAVLTALSALAGTDAGPLEPVEPAEPDDDRVDALTRVLRDRSWRGLSLDRLCEALLTALDDWQHARADLDRGLRELLDGR